DGRFRTGKQETASLRVFAHRVDWPARQSGDDLLPRRAAVGGLVNMRPLIVEPDAVHGDVSRVHIEVARVDLRNLAPRIDRRGRAVRPIPAAVAGPGTQAII